MKTSILLLAATVLVAPLAAQNEGPGNDLIELFEKSQREGASDEELMRLLEDKALINPKAPDFKALDPEAKRQRDVLVEQLERDMEQGHFRPLKEDPKEEKKPGKVPALPRREADPAMERLLEMLQPEMKKPGLPRESALDSSAMAQPWRIGLGVEPIKSFPRSHLDIPKDCGVRVSMLASDGPAAKAGIKVNDILLSANGEKILSLVDLKLVVLEAGMEGEAVTMELLHEGKRKTVSVTPRGLESPQPPKPEASDANPAPQPQLAEMARRLDQQQAEIKKLQREVERLREKINQK